MEWVQIASTVFSVIGALSGGQEKSNQYQASAQAAEYNAAVARNKAANTTAVFGQKEEEQRRQARFIIGRQRAAGAQSGTGMGGSTMDAENQSAVMAEMDALNIRYQGSLESQGLLSQASLDDYSAAGYRTQSSSAKSGSYLLAGATALSGAANYAKLTSPSADRPKVVG